ncbi:g6052 [Coccomyxa elongata]
MCLPPGSTSNTAAAKDHPSRSADRQASTAWVSEEATTTWRTSLPEPKESLKPFSLWQALKDLIGKDILDAPLPIGQYCPLTELQFRAEELEYTELLDQASPLT